MVVKNQVFNHKMESKNFLNFMLFAKICIDYSKNKYYNSIYFY